MSRVLIVATSRKTRGGITSVIKAHETGEQWRKYHCVWIQTHRDGPAWRKMSYYLSAWIEFLCLLPFCDVVHFHISERNTAERKRLFIPLTVLFKKKIIVHFHSFSPETTINGAHSELYKYLFTNADAVVVLSDFWREAVNEKFNLGEKVRVIYNPCMITKCPKQYEKTKTILYAGTLNKRKGYADFIKAFVPVAKKHRDWRIVLAGNGEEDTARSLAKEFGVENQVELLGWVSGEAKDKAYKQAMVFCLPSYAEGFPMAVLDAWAYGLPVITTPVGGIPDIAVDGENMLLFNPGDIAKLSECLERMITDVVLRNRISKESSKLAATVFNVNTVCKQVGDLYDELLTSK